MNKKVLSALTAGGVIILGAGIMLLLSSFRAEPAKTNEAPRSRSVRTVLLEPATQVVWIEGDGFLKSARELDIYADMPGRIEETLNGLKGGTPVNEGDLLLRLDDTRVRLAYESARTDLIYKINQFISVAGTESTEWDEYLERLTRARPDSLPSLPKGDRRLDMLAVTKGVTASYYQLESTALDLKDHTITAPFTGILSGEGVTAGAMISPGTSLAVLWEAENLELILSLPGDELAGIEPGSQVIVSEPGRAENLAGYVMQKESFITSGSQTGRLFIALPVPRGEVWLPGSYVQARIRGPRWENALRIPREVLIRDEIPLYHEGALSLEPAVILDRDGGDYIIENNLPFHSEYVETVLLNPLEGMLLTREED